MPLVDGAPLAFPYYAVLANAFQQIVVMKAPVGGNVVNYVIGSDNFELVTILSAVYSTSAVAGTRTAYLSCIDQDGNVIFRAPSTFAHGPSVIVSYVWSAAIASPFTGPNNFGMIPLPSLVMSPGYSFTTNVTNGDPGDRWTQPVVTTLRVPTGSPTRTTTAIAPAHV